MLAKFLPLVDWSNGVISAIIMFAIFLALFIMLLVFMAKGKKKDE